MRILFVFFLSVIFVGSAVAQNDTIRLRNQSAKATVITDRPPQAVYFQVGGSAPLLSVNYDRRFNKRVNGLGFAAGVGFWGSSGVTVFSLPVSLNYLMGTRSHFIELAGGATFITGSVDLFDESDANASGFIYHLNAGYRYQPANGGFFFRGGISPLFAGEGYGTSFYLGFGHNF